MLLRFDGGSQPNPGPCAGSFALYKDHVCIAEGGRYHPYGTNNIGEYSGLLTGLEYVEFLAEQTESPIEHLTIEGDSLLVISQLNGVWKVRMETLLPYYQSCKKILASLPHTLRHIPRKENSHADQLSDKTIERKEDWLKTVDFYQSSLSYSP